jgi:hypothetical protein
MLHKNNIAKKSPKGLDNSAKIGYNGTMMIEKGYKMSSLKEYTLEIYKSDKRTKEGRRLYAKQDFDPVTEAYINAVAESKRKLGFIVEVYETFVTKTNLMGGKEFQERYDTPYYCSPSSESYWSM